jgi:hypothetical protein
MANDISGVADLALSLGPIAGPAFVMWFLLSRNGADKRHDPVTDLDAKVDKILDRLARLETKVEERFK